MKESRFARELNGHSNSRDFTKTLHLTKAKGKRPMNWRAMLVLP
ncbi:unnamed protein product [Acidithrix sp. C25]|nr:unnamed protein product [Acidithrix sp. C25]